MSHSEERESVIFVRIRMTLFVVEPPQSHLPQVARGGIGVTGRVAVTKQKTRVTTHTQLESNPNDNN